MFLIKVKKTVLLLLLSKCGEKAVTCSSARSESVSTFNRRGCVSRGPAAPLLSCKLGGLGSVVCALWLPSNSPAGISLSQISHLIGWDSIKLCIDKPLSDEKSEGEKNRGFIIRTSNSEFKICLVRANHWTGEVIFFIFIFFWPRCVSITSEIIIGSNLLRNK